MPVAPPDIDRFSKILLRLGPAAHWILDEQGCVTHAVGDTVRLFQQMPETLLGRRIPDVTAGRMARRWARAQARVFTGETVLSEFVMGEPAGAYLITHLPVRDGKDRIAAAAGFAHDVRRPAETEKAAKGSGFRRELEESKARTSEFLHDGLAQSLGSMGLQLDLLRLDLEDGMPELAARAADIQRLLDDVLSQVRAFASGFSREPR